MQPPPTGNRLRRSGYSSAGRSPALPACASPDALIITVECGAFNGLFGVRPSRGAKREKTCCGKYLTFVFIAGAG